MVLLRVTRWLLATGGVVAAVVVAACGAGPGDRAVIRTLGHPGSGAFGRPFAVAPPGTAVLEGGNAAVNEAGRVVAAWAAAVVHGGELLGGPVQARVGDMSGRFGPVVTLGTSPTVNDAPAVAVGADDSVAVMWAGSGSRTPVRIAVASGRGGFGAPVIVGRGGPVRLAGVAVAPDGHVTAVWQSGYAYGHTRVHVVRGRAGHYAPLLGGALGLAGSDPTLVAQPDGAALLTFAPARDPDGPAVRLVRMTAASSRAGEPIDAPAGLPFAGPGGIALGIAGRPGADQRVALRDPGGTFGAPRRVASFLGETDASVGHTIGPNIALPADGSLSAAWEVNRALDGDNDEEIVAARVMVSSTDASGAFGHPQRVSEPSRVAEDPRIAAVSSTSVVIWRESAQMNEAAIQRDLQRAARRSAALQPDAAVPHGRSGPTGAARRRSQPRGVVGSARRGRCASTASHARPMA